MVAEAVGCSVVTMFPSNPRALEYVLFVKELLERLRLPRTAIYKRTGKTRRGSFTGTSFLETEAEDFQKETGSTRRPGNGRIMNKKQRILFTSVVSFVGLIEILIIFALMELEVRGGALAILMIFLATLRFDSK